MPNYIQIGDDPTKWWLIQPINPSQLAAGQPLSLEVAAPISGTLVLSGRFASVAVFNVPSANFPPAISDPEAAIYLPTATGPSSGHVGYALPVTADGSNIANQIVTAMRNGHSQTIALYGGATLVLNGATVPFVVIKPGALGGSEPHGSGVG